MDFLPKELEELIMEMKYEMELNEKIKKINFQVLLHHHKYLQKKIKTARINLTHIRRIQQASELFRELHRLNH